MPPVTPPPLLLASAMRAAAAGVTAKVITLLVGVARRLGPPWRSFPERGRGWCPRPAPAPAGTGRSPGTVEVEEDVHLVTGLDQAGHGVDLVDGHRDGDVALRHGLGRHAGDGPGDDEHAR